MRRWIILMALMACAVPGLAQQRRPLPAPVPTPKEEPQPEQPAAYEPDLLKLAEVLGTLSYMSGLCQQQGSASWRDKMNQLIDAEGTTPQRKERLAGAYNRGYVGHQPTHRTCNDRSREVIDRLVLQGQRITRDIATRFAG
jgi:uncharacterized protein (TIGR02301 family)